MKTSFWRDLEGQEVCYVYERIPSPGILGRTGGEGNNIGMKVARG